MWTVPPDYVWAAIKMEVPGDSKELPDEKLTIKSSLNDVLPVNDDFVEAWSRATHEGGGGALAAPP